MPNQEDIAHQQELLAAYRRTLAQYLKQQALISELFIQAYSLAFRNSTIGME